MSRLLSISPVLQAGAQRIFKGYIRQLLEPVGSKLIQLIRKHFPVIGKHIHFCNPVTQLPDDPVLKFPRLLLSAVAAASGNGRQYLHL